MPHIVTEKCVKCKYTDCVEVCPVDCFYEGDDYLVIDPDVCIDCGVCIPECPIDAIVNDENHIDGESIEYILSSNDKILTEQQRNLKFMAKFNKSQSKILPNIVQRQEPKQDAEEWVNDNNKIRFIKKNNSDM
jgi:ferredoxin